MSHNIIISPCGLRTALLGSAAGTLALAVLQGQALAQTADEIVITGSRIPQANLLTTSPVVQIGADDVNIQGVTRIEDLVNQLPQAFPQQNATVSNGATGTATVNLRSLGATRTLVLIDGKRMNYGSPFDAAPDINMIPTQLVERIEVLTGGASAVYGSDAIAGVVNFIMKKDYEGLQLDAQYSFYAHHNDFEGPGTPKLRDVIAERALTNPENFRLPESNVTDGYGRQISVIMGTSSPDDTVRIQAYFTWQNNEPVLQANRDYSACSIFADEVQFFCGGSFTSFPGRFTDFGLNFSPIFFDADGSGVGGEAADDAINAVVASQPSFNFTIDSGAAGFRPFNNALDLYNFGPTNYYLRPDERYAFGAFGHYDISPGVELYAQLMFTDYDTTAQIAPGGSFGEVGTIRCDSAIMSANQQLLLCGGDNPLVPGLYNGYTLDGSVVVPDLGADGIVGGTNDPGPDLVFGDDPSTPLVDEAADDVINTDGLGVVDTDLLTPGNQGLANLFILRRNVEGGGRQDTHRFKSYRAVVGVRGPAWQGWDYDIAAQYSKVEITSLSLARFATAHFAKAIDVVDNDPGPGVDLQCRSFIDGSDPACRPYNVFNPSAITAESLAYLQVPGVQIAQIDQRVVTGALTGDLGTWGLMSPWAVESVKGAFGFEIRRDALESVSDSLLKSGGLMGQGSATPDVKGAVDVWELFTEARMPLIENALLAKLVSIDSAYRYSKYDNHVSAHTYKFGADWAPTDDFRFRTSFQHAIRAANVVELFTTQVTVGFIGVDPCGEALTATLAQCLATGVPAAQYGSPAIDDPLGGFFALIGGNPDLVPEAANTYTIGVVVTPAPLPGFVATMDWFSIKISGPIGVTGGPAIVDACYVYNIVTQCARIHRNPAGQLWLGNGHVEDLNTNIGGLSTKGVDVSLLYTAELADWGAPNWGTVNFRLLGTWLDTWQVDLGVGTPVFDCVGLFAGGCGTPTPQWRHRFRIGWQAPWHLDLSVTWRHYGAVDMMYPDPALRIDRFFDAENYFDLAGSVNLTRNTRLRFGVNNVVDDDPPIAEFFSSSNGNTFPETYDALGRYIFAGITIEI